MSRRHWILTIALGSLCAVNGCGGLIDFTSPSALGEGVRGKAWGTAHFLEASEASPDKNTDNRTHNSFDVTVSGSTAYLVMSLYETSLFKPYARSYTDGVGWALPGTGFSRIVDTAVDIGHVGVTTASSGTVIAVFQATNSTIVAPNSGTAWEAASVSTDTSGTVVSTEHQGAHPFLALAREGSGDARIVYQDAGAEKRTNWSGSALGTTSSDPLAMASGVRALKAGTNRVCALYETTASTRSVRSRCELGGVSTFSDVTARANGFDAASDGTSGIMLVYYAYNSSTTKYSVKAALASDGTWPAAASHTTISTGMPSNYEGVPSLVDGTIIQNVRPAITYIGTGSYLAVWVGIDPSAATSQMFYNIYAEGAWQTARTLGSEEAYTTRPHHESVALFTNSDQNVGIAVNHLSAEGSTAAGDTHELLAARYHSLNGWLAFVTRGRGCLPVTPVAACTQRPVGAILPSGNTVVLFQDQDSSGVFRIAGVEFK